MSLRNQSALTIMARRSDDGGRCVYMDEAWGRFTGALDGASQPGAWVDAVHDEDLLKCLKTFAGVIELRKEASVDYRAWHIDGSLREMHERALPIVDPMGAVRGLYHITVDMSATRAGACRRHDEPEQRTDVIHATNHRVRNQLQTIVSLVRMQSRTADSHQARTALEEAARRIEAVALAERQFQSAPGMLRLDLHLEALAAPLAALLARQGIDLAVDLAPIELPYKFVVPLALLANEALTSTLKHGFPDGRSGRATLATIIAGNTLKLVIAEDGVSASDAALRDSDPGSGIGLIRALAAQVGGELVIERQPGMSYVVSLPLPAQRVLD